MRNKKARALTRWTDGRPALPYPPHRVAAGNKNAILGGKIFIFDLIFMGFFSLDSSQWEFSESLPCHFQKTRDTKAKGKTRYFQWYIKFSFFISFDGFLLLRAFRIVTAHFFYLLPFSRCMGPKVAKTIFSGACKHFVNHIIVVQHIYKCAKCIIVSSKC